MKNDKQSSILLLCRLAKPEKFKLTGAALLVLAGSFFSMVPLYASYKIIEEVINTSFTWESLQTYALWAAGAILLQMLCWGLAMTQSHIAAYGILFNLRRSLAQKLTRLPLGFYEKNSTGSLRKMMMGDIEAIEEFLAHNLVDFLSIIFVPLLICGWLCTIHWPLALICVTPVFAGFVLQRFRMWKEAAMVQEFFQLKGRMNTTILDFIRGMPVIKAFNQSVFSFQKYRKQAEKYSDYWIGMNKKAALYFAIYTFMMDSGIILVLPISSWMYLNGTLTLPSLLLFLFVGIGLTRYMKQLTQFGSNITQIGKGAEAVQNLLEAPEMSDFGNTPMPQRYNIEFNSVNFGYGKKEVIKNLTFKCEEGTVTALTGDSGSGKTTIARLLSRFWDIKKGSIKIGGIDIRNIPLNDLMKNIAFVFQDVFLFNDSVLENIRMGNPNLSLKDIQEIAKKSQCHEFIKNLPDGYDTIIGAKGTYLSGGEKQRIAIARAIAKDAPIVVLDEATSYADVENEEKIQLALSDLLRNKTVIVIAHRLSTIRNSQQIIVLKEGAILEKGKHKELLRAQNRYAEMWKMHKDATDWKAQNTNIQKV